MNVSGACQSRLKPLNKEPVDIPSRSEEVVKEVFLKNIPDDAIGKAPIETFRNDVLAGVLGPMLDSKDLAALSGTSKTMYTNIKPFLDRAWAQRRAEITIGPEQWKSVGFEVKEVPPLPDDIDEILKSNCPYFEGKKVYETHKLILIPSGLSIEKQGSLMRHRREGDVETVFSYINGNITGKYRKKEVEKPYWALITTDLIPKSRGELFEVQEGLIQEGYEVPSVLDAIALVTMDKECSKGKEGYLLPKDPGTFTHCKESIGMHQLLVGGFALPGLSVHMSLFGGGNVGVLALRKFC